MMTGADFKSIRNQLGLSCQELADELGLKDKRIILRIEAGEAEPTRIMELAVWKLAEGVGR